MLYLSFQETPRHSKRVSLGNQIAALEEAGTTSDRADGAVGPHFVEPARNVDRRNESHVFFRAEHAVLDRRDTCLEAGLERGAAMDMCGDVTLVASINVPQNRYMVMISLWL
ncbi:MAG: hypothetical protein MI920_27800 [Kiloniellales bacterium]|nr:hypothetical protein [Kiloniellales bacterium]